jgi:cupin 2 domain-containing protein
VIPRFGALAEGPWPAPGEENVAPLLAEAGVLVERIASHRAASPDGFWYDQPSTEFVLLVAGEAALGFSDGADRPMRAGDWAILPARCRHRVAWTSDDALWLAVHLPAATDPAA